MQNIEKTIETFNRSYYSNQSQHLYNWMGLDYDDNNRMEFLKQLNYAHIIGYLSNFDGYREFFNGMPNTTKQGESIPKKTIQWVYEKIVYDLIDNLENFIDIDAVKCDMADRVYNYCKECEEKRKVLCWNAEHNRLNSWDAVRKLDEQINYYASLDTDAKAEAVVDGYILDIQDALTEMGMLLYSQKTAERKQEQRLRQENLLMLLGILGIFVDDTGKAAGIPILDAIYLTCKHLQKIPAPAALFEEARKVLYL